MKENNLKISVVLPVFNGVNTLKTTLDSLSNQTLKEFELICCIDGTIDGSELLLESYRTIFSKLIIIRNNVNIGLGATMNRLMFHANCDYVAIAEQDDFYYPDRLELQFKIFESNSNVGIVSGMSEFWNGEKVVFDFPGLLKGGNQYPRGKDMFLLNFRNQIKVVNSCMMIRRRTHIDNGLYFTKHHPNISIDWTYILRFSLVSEIYGIPKVLVRLDRRNDRDSVTSNKKKQFLAARELVRSFKYEYPNLISGKDYAYAKATNYLMELSYMKLNKYVLNWLFFVITNPLEIRYYINLRNRIHRKLFKK